jgi:hypothetical protein
MSPVSTTGRDCVRMTCSSSAVNTPSVTMPSMSIVMRKVY